VWFDEQPDGARADWIYHRQRSSPLTNYRWHGFYTLLIDIGKSPLELFAEMDDKTARRITEAQGKDKVRCERCDSKDPKVLDEVGQMWNQFALAQKTPLLDRPWLDQFSQAGALDVVAAKDPAGRVLVYHLVLLRQKRARQLIAISHYHRAPDVAWRAAVSRANSLIHWHNFLTYREEGIRFFDFGGWYPGTTNIQYLGFNQFKKGFGGKVVLEYDCKQPVTVKGRILLMAAEVLARVRRAGALSDDTAAKPKERDVTNEENTVSAAVR